MRWGARVIVLSLLTTRWYLKQKTVCGSSLAGHGRYAGVGSAGGWAKRALWRGEKRGGKGGAAARAGGPGPRRFVPRGAPKGAHKRARRPPRFGRAGRG